MMGKQDWQPDDKHVQVNLDGTNISRWLAPVAADWVDTTSIGDKWRTIVPGGWSLSQTTLPANRLTAESLREAITQLRNQKNPGSWFSWAEVPLVDPDWSNLGSVVDLILLGLRENHSVKLRWSPAPKVAWGGPKSRLLQIYLNSIRISAHDPIGSQRVDLVATDGSIKLEVSMPVRLAGVDDELLAIATQEILAQYGREVTYTRVYGRWQPEPEDSTFYSAGPVLGWRMWNLEPDGDPYLDSPVSWTMRGQYGHEWLLPTFTAVCPHSDHDAPDWDCECGIYAEKVPTKRMDAPFLDTRRRHAIRLYGLVALEGEVIEHEEGYRAQAATCLLLYGQSTYQDLPEHWLGRGIPVTTDWRDVKRFAKAFAEDPAKLQTYTDAIKESAIRSYNERRNHWLR